MRRFESCRPSQPDQRPSREAALHARGKRMAAPDFPDGYRLALSDGPTLRSGWNSVLLPSAVRRSIATYAAGPDDSLWAAADRIGRYSFTTAAFEPVFDVAALSIAPVSTMACWAVAYDGGATSIVHASTDSGIETLPELPDDDLPQHVTAGADGTVYLFSFDHHWYALQADRQGGSTRRASKYRQLRSDRAMRSGCWAAVTGPSDCGAGMTGSATGRQCSRACPIPATTL
jgi:hypothetical protein